MARIKKQNLVAPSGYDWSKTLKYLETLIDRKEKIKHLIEVKTNFLQNKDWQEIDFDTSFDERCELEIKKLKEISELEATSQDNKSNTQLEAFTHSQLVLIFYYFFTHNGLEPRINIDIAPIAKSIHLLTGKEFKATTHSDFYAKLRTVPNFKSDKGLITDLEFIKPFFQRVQLNEIVKMIENEIDKARNEIKQQRKTKI